MDRGVVVDRAIDARGVVAEKSIVDCVTAGISRTFMLSFFSIMLLRPFKGIITAAIILRDGQPRMAVKLAILRYLQKQKMRDSKDTSTDLEGFMRSSSVVGA